MKKTFITGVMSILLLTTGVGTQAGATSLFVKPVEESRITLPFGPTKNPISGVERLHKGTDYVAKLGTEVRSASEGKVLFAGEKQGYGKVVIIQHKNGYQTLYAHLSSIQVKQGQVVKKGQVIGNVGQSGMATGPHLHFEVKKDGKNINPNKVL